MESNEIGLGTKIAVFIAAVIAWSHDAVGLTITNFLATPIMNEFHVGTADMGFVFSAQYISAIFGAIIFGELADRIGRRLALVLAVTFEAVSTALTALANSFLVLAALRIISGLGVSWGIGYALISEELGHRRRGLYGGLLQGTFILGYIISAITTKFVYPHYGWRAAYLIALYPIPIILPLMKFVPESTVWSKSKELEEEKATDKEKSRVKVLLKGPFLKLTLIATITFWAAEAAYHSVVDWAPTMVHVVFKYSVANASVLVMEIALLAIPVLIIIGAASDYIGRRLAFSLSALTGMTASLLVWYFTIVTFNPSKAITALFIVPFGFGSHALFGIWLSEIYPTSIRATATGFVFSVARGLALGGFIVGLLTQKAGVPLVTSMMLTASFLFALMSIFAWLLPETKGKVILAEPEIGGV
ncbi:MAG: MFS transporter [Desulfurococcales archaeon]|nr:MFS transporter [Desulfurococcales archaeon]